LSTDCEFCDHNEQAAKYQFELKHEVNFAAYPDGGPPGFAIRTNTNLVGKADGEEPDNEDIKINCKFIANYLLADDKLSAKDYEPITEIYANQLYPSVRQHLIDMLGQMGVSGLFLPQSLIPAESAEKK
jgi:hypothetical protein